MNRSEFLAVFQELTNDILAEVKSTGIIELALNWVKENLEYNVPGGKLNRGLSVVDTYKIINPSATPQQLKDCTILGWCIELLQAFFLVSDDIMDASVTRRGQPCWYRVEKVKMVAINDAFILEACIYKLLKKHFKNHEAYGNFMEVFHETTWQTEMGQLVDLLLAPEGEVDLNRFSIKSQHYVSKYKTAFYSFYLPVALALYYAGIRDEKSHEQAKSILVPIGEYFQVQDDYLDCYGAPEVIGKIGTDIEDNKNSWLIGKALELVNPEQRKILDDNYAKKDEKNVQAVKQVYRDLNLEQEYLKFEEETYKILCKDIEKLDANVLNPEIFLTFLNKIYKRSK